MKWRDWSIYYNKVIQILEIDRKADEKSSEEYLKLAKIAHSNGYAHNIKKILERKIKRVWIFGAGPSLPNDFNIFKDNYNSNLDLVVAADGSSTFLHMYNVTPDVIVSDFDGDLAILSHFSNKKVLILLHAHGDNLPTVLEYFPKFTNKGPIIPTIQTKPEEPFLYNFGGFTDGDRCISFALDLFPQSKIALLGFTFGKIQGRYSKPFLESDSPASEFKLKKLNFAKFFIQDYLVKKYPNQIWNLSQPTEYIPGILEDIQSFI